MKWLKENWWLIIILILLGFWVSNQNKEPEKIEVPIERIVPVPVIQRHFDTIVPDPKTVIVRKVDSTIYNEYRKLKDSIQKDSAYRDAITIREYNQVFEDEYATDTVYSKVRGHLLEQSLLHTSKPRTITYRDTITIQPKNSFGISGEVGVPTVPGLSVTPVLKAGVYFRNKKGNTTSFSYDTEGRLWVGKTFKIF